MHFLRCKFIKDKMKLKKYISIVLLLLVTSFAFSQVKFQAKVSKKQLAVNERLRIDFEMNRDGDNFNPPSFSNFNLLGEPNQSVSHSWVNGVRSFKKTYSYFLAPKKRGAFTIGQATIEIDGEIYKTSPIKITVTTAIEKPKDPNDPNYLASESIHLVAEISKTNPYVNEAITVLYKLYVSPTTGVDNWQTMDSPKYNGFWSQNIKNKNQKVETGTYKGEEYRFLVLDKVVLYPQKTGKLIIEPLKLDVSVQVPTNRRNIFGERMMARVNKTFSAGNKVIQVKPLPVAGKPANFSGAVGRFSFKVSATKTSLKATESLQAKVEVSGQGNLKLLTLPKIKLPSSLEVYEPEHKEKIRTNLSGMKGRVFDTYTIVPQYKGKYPIPSISFSYFDLKTETYKRIASKEIVIDVVEGPLNTIVAKAPTSISSQANIEKTPVNNVDSQFAYIKTQTNLEPIKRTFFFKTSLFWSALLLPFFAIPLALFISNKKNLRDADVSGNRKRRANKLARKYLKEAKRNLTSKEAFYVALEKSLHNYLKAKLQIETSDLSKDKIEILLLERNVAAPVIKDFNSILESCELARYTPINKAAMQDDYNKAAQTISLIDKQAQ